MTAFAAPTRLRRSEAGLSFVIGLNLCIAGLYTNFAVNIGGFWVPGIPILVGTIFLIPHLRNLYWLGWLVLFLTVSLVAGGSGPEFFNYRLTSWLQLIAAIGCAHIILCAMDFPETIRKTLFLWMIFVVGGVFLETEFSAFRAMSDAFRYAVFEGRFIYDSEVRDLREYGFVRPKLFTQEPSHVAKAFVVFGAGWYVLAARWRLPLLLACTALVTLFLGSPIILLVLPLAWFLDRVASGRSVSGVVAAGLPVLGIIAIAIGQVFSTRLARILSGQDASFVVRYQGPYEVALKTIEQYPIFGIGIGAKEALWEQIHVVYSPFFRSEWGASWLYSNYLSILGNAFANSLAFFGIVGAVIFYLLIAQWANRFDIKALVSLPVVLLFFQLDGALEGLRMWASIALVLGCYALANRNNFGKGLVGTAAAHSESPFARSRPDRQRG